MDATKIGQRLRKLREDRGQTKSYVAKQIDIPYRTMCAYEYGERIPCDEVKMKLAKYYNTTVGSIFFEEDDHKKK